MTRRNTAAILVLPAVLTAVFLAVLGFAGGCTQEIHGEPVSEQVREEHRVLIAGYFAALNTAAGQGSAAQEQLFTSTQHPDFRDLHCSLQGLTLTAEPAYTTLHTDPHWRPTRTGDPIRGTVYSIAATITVLHNSAVLGNQVGSLHVVVLDGTAYGFTPCPT